MSRQRHFAVAVLLLVAAGNALAITEYTGRVVGVTDGDTVVVLVDKHERKVRLHGIDAPEQRQDFGTRAKQFASDRAFGKTVRVEMQYRDRYGRDVGIVHLEDGAILNHDLVQAGMAWWYERYAPDDQTLKRLHEEARDARRGLWSHPEPQAPWEFRARRTAERSRVNTGDDDARTAPHSAPTPSETHERRRASQAYHETPESSRGNLVVITPTGEKYHAIACRHARHGKRVTRDAAEEAGYRACKMCKGKVTRRD